MTTTIATEPPNPEYPLEVCHDKALSPPQQAGDRQGRYHRVQ